MNAAAPVTSADALIEEAQRRLRRYLDDGKRVIASCSFQTHSIPMLVVLAEVGGIPVYFLDTGFHFPETLTYRDRIAEMLGLEVISLRSAVTKQAQSNAGHGFYFTSDPDYCCYLNKTAPMESVARDADVWVSGVRRDQNENRRTFDAEMEGPNGSVRYHPMLDWTDEMIREHLAAHRIPGHPLDAHGYESIGCAPCTMRVADPEVAGDRAGRWVGQVKTECGLHLDLVKR